MVNALWSAPTSHQVSDSPSGSSASYLVTRMRFSTCETLSLPVSMGDSSTSSTEIVTLMESESAEGSSVVTGSVAVTMTV